MNAKIEDATEADGPQAPDSFLGPEGVCALIPGMTESRLKMLRYNGTGPAYFRPTPKTIVYSEREVRRWVESSERTITRDAG